MEFTYNSYFNLIRSMKRTGYSTVTFADSGFCSIPKVILRHDVDISPIVAKEFAVQENAYGIRSTYFVMISSSFYNAFERDNDRAIVDIMNMGHEIGLHFDITKYKSQEEDELKEEIQNEMLLLSGITGKMPTSISWHIPSKIYLGTTLEFLRKAGINNSYDPEFFEEYKYLSDSNMHWREDPVAYIDPIRYPKIQMLTHPIWYENVRTEKKDILNGAFKKNRDRDIEYLNGITGTASEKGQ